MKATHVKTVLLRFLRGAAVMAFAIAAVSALRPCAWAAEGAETATLGIGGIDVQESIDNPDAGATVGADVGSAVQNNVIEVSPDEGGEGVRLALVEAGENATASQPFLVKVQPGTYGLERGLHIYSNTTLDATGCTFVYAEPPKKKGESTIGNMLKVGAGQDDPVVGYGYENIHVIGGTWDAGWGSNTVIKPCHVQNFSFVNATVKRSYNAHMMEIAGAKDVVISGCTFLDSQMDSNYRWANEVIQIDILQSYHINGYLHLEDKYGIDYICKNITIDKNTFKNCCYGVGAHTAVVGRYFTGIRITNNAFSNISRRVIACRNFKDSVVSGNVMSTHDVAISVTNMPEDGTGMFNSLTQPSISRNVVIPNCNLVIENNRITSDGDMALRVSGEIFTSPVQTTCLTKEGKKAKTDVIAKGDYYVRGVTIRNNTVTAKGRYPIRLTLVKDVTVSGNTVNAAGQEAGIAVYATSDKNVHILNNVINGNPKIGIVVLTVSGSSYGKTKVGKVNGNTVNGAKVVGIKVYKASATSVDGNKLLGTCGSWGIAAFNTAKVGSISGNTVKKSKKQAIKITTKAKVTKIANNVLKKSGKGAIAVTTKAKVSSITGNTMTKTGSDHAIRIEMPKTAKVSITRNTISGNPKLFGVFVHFGKATLKKNTISNCKVGIRGNAGTKVKESGNTFANCGEGAVIS